MRDKNSQNFDLSVLLRTGDLDIRKAARNKVSLLVKDYYSALSKFINYRPPVVEVINRIATQEGDGYDFLCMADIRTMLRDIGCFKLLSVVDDIINTGKRGHKGFAADCAKKISDDVQRIYTRIAAAQKAASMDNETDTDTDTDTHENFTIPHEDQPLKKVLQMLDHEESTRKMRILAVDDAPVIIKTISAVLSDDYKVYGMTDPTMLENFLHQITPELFLLDYKMPELSGFDLIPIIRSFEEHQKTPIIILTSLGTIDHVSAALTLGACDFITKPFQGNILREKVAKHIVRKKLC